MQCLSSGAVKFGALCHLAKQMKLLMTISAMLKHMRLPANVLPSLIQSRCLARMPGVGAVGQKWKSEHVSSVDSSVQEEQDVSQTCFEGDPSVAQVFSVGMPGTLHACSNRNKVPGKAL